MKSALSDSTDTSTTFSRFIGPAAVTSRSSDSAAVDARWACGASPNHSFSSIRAVVSGAWVL